MKRIRVNAALLAMMLGATATFAFKAPATSTKTALVWYKFNGGDQSNPANYSRMSSTPTCNGSAALCAIQGDDNGTHPAQTTVDSPIDERFLQQ